MLDKANCCLSVSCDTSSSRETTANILLLSHLYRSSIWLPKLPGDCFVAEYFFVLLSAQHSRAPSLVSINTTAALSPPLAALLSLCPTPSSFPSVCTDPWGPPWLPDGARHGPTSINISAGLCWWAELRGFLFVFFTSDQSQVTFLRNFWEWNENS